jgi:hypothetical protein
MSLDGIDEWDESFLQEAMRIEFEALASRNLPIPTPCPVGAPQPPFVPPSLLAPPPPQAIDLVKFDRSADVASAMPEVPFSPPRELSQRYGIARPRTGDNFEVVDSWGDFGNTDSVRKNNRELERLKVCIISVSELTILNNLIRHYLMMDQKASDS